jgi:predicted nucleotidyltransferase
MRQITRITTSEDEALRGRKDEQEMEMSSIEEIVAYLKNNKRLFYDRFGVTRIGIFGSFIRGEQTRSSDIDIVVEMEKSRKNIHSFLQLKRLLEKELARKVDLGFEHSLKPMVREKIIGQIVYV